MDNGHYHPTELVSDKIPAMLCFYPEIALHVTRGVRWDSDHVLLLDDETREIAKEIVDRLLITHPGAQTVRRHILETVTRPDVHNTGNSCLFWGTRRP